MKEKEHKFESQLEFKIINDVLEKYIVLKCVHCGIYENEAKSKYCKQIDLISHSL